MCFFENENSLILIKNSGRIYFYFCNCLKKKEKKKLQRIINFFSEKSKDQVENIWKV